MGSRVEKVLNSIRDDMALQEKWFSEATFVVAKSKNVVAKEF